MLAAMARSTGEKLTLQQRADQIQQILAHTYPDAHCELDFSSPLELTVATVLSAQCTDERVNRVTPELFSRYRQASDYAAADPVELAAILRPLGFQHRRAKQLIGLGESLAAHYDGEIPQELAQLTALPGVGRKTAQVVRGNAFDLPGLTLDTHVQRVSRRLGLTTTTTALAMEKELAALIDPAQWTNFSHQMIFHGRRQCHARSPQCASCPLRHLCPAAEAAAVEAIAPTPQNEKRS